MVLDKSYPGSSLLAKGYHNVRLVRGNNNCEDISVIVPNGVVLRKVVFDVDDTLCPYTRSIADSLNIVYETWIDFHNLNPNYDDEQKAAITRAYHDPVYYERIEFYPGFSEIQQLERLGVIVQFNSTSFTQNLLDTKRRRMMAAAPDLRPGQFVFRVVNVQDNIKKDYDDDTFIVVDDNPYAVAKSQAPYIIMPATPWNQTPKARALVQHKRVFYTPAGDLYAIYGIIENLLLPMVS